MMSKKVFIFIYIEFPSQALASSPISEKALNI
jgi:hypothetical protein